MHYTPNGHLLTFTVSSLFDKFAFETLPPELGATKGSGGPTFCDAGRGNQIGSEKSGLGARGPIAER